MANKQVTIEFTADDKGLVAQLEKLNKISKELVDTQKQITTSEEQVKASKSQHIQELKKLHTQLQIAGKDFKDVGYDIITMDQAYKGNIVSLGKIKNQTKQYLDTLKKEKSTRDTNIITLRKYNNQLKGVGVNLKKLKLNSETYKRALKGEKLALDQVRVATQKYIQNLKKVEVQSKKTGQRTRILGGTFAVLRSKLLLFNFMLGLGIRQLGKFGTQAAKVESMERAFGTLTGGTELASDSLNKLEIATNNTMSQFDLFQQANNAMILGVSKNSDEMAEMFDIAQRLGRALGRDTASSVESLITGIGRQSRLMLDNIGIIVKSEEAYEAYANKLGVATDELTDAERKQAFLEATMASARAKVATLGDEVLTNQDAYDKLSASASNLTAELGNKLQPILTTLASAFTTIADEVTETMRVTRILKTDYASLSTHEERREHLLAQIAKQEKTLARMTRMGSADSKTHAMLTKAIADNKFLLHNVNKLVEKSQERAIKLSKEEAEEQKKLLKAEQDRLDKIAQEEIDEKARIKDREFRDKEQAKRKKAHEAFMKKLEEDRQSARETIFEDDLQFQLKQLDAQAEYFKSLKLGADAEVQLEKWLADSKLKVREDFEEERISKQKEAEEKLLDARKTIFENNLEFQLNELDNQRDQLSQLLTTNEEKLALQDWFNNQQLELTKENLENNKIEFSAFNDFYKAFTDSIIDQDMTAKEKKQAFQDAMVDGTVKFFGKIIQEHIKQYLVQETLNKVNATRNAANAVAEVALLKPIYAGLASVKTLALGTPYIATVGVAAQAYKSSLAIAERGGLIGGNRHSQGGTIIEAEQGEFIMSRNAVESIGVDNLFKMNEGRGAGITINISAPLVDETVVDSILPAIEKAQRMNLA